MHWDLGGYRPYDVQVVGTFDIDKREVGKDVSPAVFQLPNCTAVFHDKVPETGVKVAMGKMEEFIAGKRED